MEVSTNRADLWDSLIQPLTRQYEKEDTRSILSFYDWVTQKPPLVVDGIPFGFDKHEYLKEPYQDDHPFQIDMKATQLGATTRAMLRSVYNGRYRAFRGILYLFPSRTDVSDFSKSRIDPLIAENPDTIGQWIKDEQIKGKGANATNIKRIWNCFLYLRGMKSRVGLKSVPADFIVYDELDEAPPKAIDMAEKRMSHSKFKEKMMLSNPTTPDYGIHRHFLLSDQRYWLLKCGCGQWNNLVDDFPQCLVEVKKRVIRACRKCGKALNPSRGQWVAKKPHVKDRRGRQYSQLYSHLVSPAEILHDFRTTDNLKDFYNLTIGVPYIAAENRLDVEEVLDLCGDEGISLGEKAPCFMGVDQKGNALHVVIGKDHETKAGKIVHLGIYGTGHPGDWDLLDPFMKNFNVTRSVVDAQPDTRGARAFAERFKGRVFLNYYSESQRGSYKWDEEKLQVNCNRTESLDASHQEIKTGQIILPSRQNEIVQKFAEQLHNVGKILEEDEETGSKRYFYVKLGPDHFRHAYNYEAMARQHASGLLYPELL